MKSVEQIEKSLGRMVPAALSQRTSRELDEMIESLAIQDGEVPRGHWRTTAGWSAAAAALVLGAFSFWQWNPEKPGAGQPTGAASPSTGIELLSQTDRVGKTTDAGLMADDGGGMLRVLRCQVVEEEMVRDKRSGITVRVTEPREETVLIPVSNF
jgi:hypothetical protein